MIFDSFDKSIDCNVTDQAVTLHLWTAKSSGSLADAHTRPSHVGSMSSNQSEGDVLMLIDRLTVTPLAATSDVWPLPRGGATLTQMDNGDVYMIGGANREAECYSDVYAFDPVSWQWQKIIPCMGRLPTLSGHSAVAIGNSIYVFGGLNPQSGDVYNDVLVFNTNTRAWSKPTVQGQLPSPRNAHAAVLLPADSNDQTRRILVFGGSSPEQGALADVWTLHIAIDDTAAAMRWESVSCTGEHPEPREMHVGTLLGEKAVYFSGGRNFHGEICTDMAVLELGSWKWQIMPMCEWNRCSHTAGAIEGHLVSFGGWNGREIRGDCSVFSENEESWISLPDKTSDSAPEEREVSARFGHCACSATMEIGGEKRSGMLVFGGISAECDLNDLVLVSASPARDE